MNPKLQPAKSEVNRSEIFVLGFDGSFGECLINYTSIEDAFTLSEFENSFLAFRRLEELLDSQGETSTLPAAIICEFGFLAEENFLLLRNVRQHPVLQYIPFIAMNRDGLNHKLHALRLGFDDYYDVPVHWKVLKERITFLSQFKKLIENCEVEEQEPLTLRIHPLKRCFDILFASLALIILSPVLLIIATLIAVESRGPLIYCSKRVGTGYQVFDFLKFRSMYKDADQRLKDLIKLNQYTDGGLFVKFNNDPRITTVGKIIRKTSLDELPQLINVLKGDMSIVGNRPLPLYEAELLTRDVWAKRFLAPAGLTGLWQITKRGKNNMSTEERINLDVAYAEQHSFWYDLKIMLKTPFALVQHENV